MQPQGTLVNQIVHKYLPYWPLFVVSIFLFLTGAFFYLKSTNPKFEASATIIIKDEKKGYDNSQAIESLDVLNTKKIVENEIEVLKSRTLMDSVVRRLQLYAPISDKSGLRKKSAYATSPIQLAAEKPDELKEVHQVSISYHPGENRVKIGNQQYSLSEWVATPYGKLRFEKNQLYQPSSTVQELTFDLIPPKVVTQQLLSNLSISSTSKLSTMVTLAFRDEVPKKAEDVLNTLIRSYTSAAMVEKSAIAKNTLTFVEDRLKAIAQDLDATEGAIQQFKSGKGAVDIGTQGQLFLENVSVNDQKISDVDMQLAVLGQVENFVSSKSNGGAIVPSTLGVSDPLLSQLLDKLYSAELERERLKGTVAENNPMLVALSDQINKLKPSIVANIQSQKKRLGSKQT